MSDLEEHERVRAQRTVPSTAPSTAMAIANWFLKKSWVDPDPGPPIDQLKLYKLVYLAQAWHLAHFSGPLFDEDVEAWTHGPIVRDLYIAFHKYGKDPIKKCGKKLVLKDGKPVLIVPEHDGSLDKFLGVVWNLYKKYSGVKLSNSTHSDGEPWKVVSNFYDLKEEPTIPLELIESAFKAKIDKQQHQ